MEFDTILLYGIVPAVIVLIMFLLACFKCGKPVAAEQNVGTIPSTNIYTLPASLTDPINRQPQHNNQFGSTGHRRISSVGDRFLVPMELLPPNFDLNSPGVQVRGDAVVVKDLKLIETPNSAEYLKQSPYNPNFI